MLRCFILLMVVLSGLTAQAQTVSVRVLKDEPVKVKGIRLMCEPLYFTSWKPNGNAGFGFGFLVNGGSLFTGEMNMRFAYGDKYHVKGDNTIPKFFNIDMMLSWHFGKATTLRSYNVKIASYETHYTYVPVEMKRRVAFGFRTGICFVGTGVNWESARSFYINDADTNYLNGTGKYVSIMAAAGMSFKFVHCALVSLDGYRKAEGGCHEFYYDVMPLIGLDNGFVRPAYDTVSYEVRVPQKQKLGWRFGWRFYDPSRSNLTLGVQVGTYAGPRFEKQYNYFLMSIGFSIGEMLKE